MGYNAERVFREKGLRCAYCGFIVDIDTTVNDPFHATVDHIQPKAKGGGDDFKNLLSCCLACNHVKDDMTLAEFRTALITGHADKPGKDKELAELKTPRYMIPYGKYLGISSYMWGGKFYFEKKGKEKEATEHVADAVKHILKRSAVENNTKIQGSVIDDFFKKGKNIVIVTNEKNKNAGPNKKAIKTVQADSVYELKGLKSITKSEKKMLYKHFDYRCCYCGCSLRAEERILGHANATPSRIDNSKEYTTKNTLCACQTCQSVRKDLTLEEFRTMILVHHGISGAVHDNKTKKRISDIYEQHYQGIFLANSRMFYFELSDKEKERIDTLWESRTMTDSYGLLLSENAEIANAFTEKQEMPVSDELISDDLNEIEDKDQIIRDFPEKDDAPEEEEIISPEKSEESKRPENSADIVRISGDACAKLTMEHEKLTKHQEMLKMQIEDIRKEMAVNEEKLAKIAAAIEAMAALSEIA